MMKKGQTQEKKSEREIFVNVGPVETRVAITESGRLVDFFMERKGLANYAGSIYKGRVTSIVKGIDAAFINIGLEKNGFLHVDDVLDKASVLREMLPDDEEVEEERERRPSSGRINEILKNGDEMMVQVVKESLGTKGPRLTTFISIPGRYLVITPYDQHIGISRRIKDRDKRNKIRQMLENIRSGEKTGWIVRTMAEDVTEEELKQEMQYLVNLWQRIKARSEGHPAPLLVYEEYGVVLRVIRDKFTDEVARLQVDSKEEFGRIIKFLKAFRPELRHKTKIYQGNTPMFQKYDLETQIDEIFERKVSLKSGGYLVIEQTEGLVAIDVNTGKFTGKKNLEETAFKTNMEAAKEIPRQLMLRDIGGIVIIDFIDMEIRGHRDNVFNMLQNELRSDKARISLRSISQFGVVEMTRQRMRKSLESASHIECPYCMGKGMIKSPDTIAIETARKIDKMLLKTTGTHKHLTVTTHPDINAALLSDQARMLSDIQRKHRCSIDLKEDKSLHIEDIIIEEH